MKLLESQWLELQQIITWIVARRHLSAFKSRRSSLKTVVTVAKEPEPEEIQAVLVPGTKEMRENEGKERYSQGFSDVVFGKEISKHP